MEKSNVGLIGLAVMGANLARNIASRGFSTLVYNRTPKRTEDFITEFGSASLEGETGSIADFVTRLERPRKIIVMVQAGTPVDAVLDELLPHLEEGDTVVDCGNSYYPDTVRREKRLSELGFAFLGCGVSGGEEGALNGPSLMPGGNREAYARLKPILDAVAARDFDGGGCVTYVGAGASGHFVKMVHNGIEYAVMQIMAEAYDVLRKAYGKSAPEIADIFERYAAGDLGSYLFDISVTVLRTKDDLVTGANLVDNVLDRAGQKGTGKWTVVDALERGVAVPSIAEAVFARNVSSQRNRRLALSETAGNSASTEISTDLPTNAADFEKMLEKALKASILSAYAQGYDLIATASDEENWGVDLAEVSRIWQGGCIIRAKVLSTLREAFATGGNEKIPHLFEIPKMWEIMETSAEDWKNVTRAAIAAGIPVPAISAGLAYYESLTDASLPANFLQGLRDHFGAHTYERTDRNGIFHSKWGT